MILYVNGQDFSAGAFAVNKFAFANDDFKYVALGSKPHPDNLEVSYGMYLSKILKLALVCAAGSNSSNQKILTSTYEYLNNLKSSTQILVIIGWAKIEKKNIIDHEKIYELHCFLKNKNIPHLFFNAVDSFSNVPKSLHKIWNNNFIEPYTKNANGQDHLFWAQYLFNHLTKHKISI